MSANPTSFEQKQKERAEVINQIKQTLTLLKRPDQVFEIRTFSKDNKTIAGLFDMAHLDECIKGILSLYQSSKAIYFVLNDFPSDLLAWSANKFRVIKSGDHTIADKHISRRTHILIDLDPKRLSKDGIEIADVSASNEEKGKAKQKLDEMLAFFRSEGWPEPLIVDSGNGYHLIFAVDLPNTPEITELVKTFLASLAQKFDDPFVQVDKKVFNPSRITKLAGTFARKGDHTENRPHRMARIVSSPNQLAIVSQELLAKIAGEFKEKAQETTPPKEKAYSEQSYNSNKADPFSRITKYLDTLPPSIAGSNGSDALFRASCVLTQGFNLSVNEALPYLESWNQTHCSPPWSHKELLHKLNDADKATSDKPRGYLLNEFTPPKTGKNTNSTSKDSSIPKNTQPPKTPGKSGRELLSQTFDPIQWVVEGLFTEGSVNVIASKPKTGKSCLVLGASLAIACGGQFLGKQVKKRDVLYLALEDSPRRLQDRASRILLNETVGEGFYYETNFPRLDLGGEEMLEQWSINHPNSVVIVDVLGKIKPPETRDNNGYSYEYSVINRFKCLAQEHNVTFILVHHNRKQDALDAFDCVSGSTGLTASVDATLVLKKDRGKADAILAITGRDVEEAEYKLQFNFPHWSMLGEANAYRVSSTQEKILTILKQSNSPLSPEEVIKAYFLEYPDDDVKKDNLRQMFYYLAKTKKIVATDRGKYLANDSYNTNNTYNSYNSYNSYNANNNSNNTNHMDKSINDDEQSTYIGKPQNTVSDDVDVRDVRISNIDSYNHKHLEKEQVTANVRNVRNVCKDVSEKQDDKNEVTFGCPPERQLARRALAVAEFLSLHPTLLTRVFVSDSKMISDPVGHSRWLCDRLNEGQNLPELITDLEGYERAIRQATKSTINH